MIELVCEYCGGKFKPKARRKTQKTCDWKCHVQRKGWKYYPDKVKNEHLLEHIKEIRARHPEWGYERITVWLQCYDKHIVNECKIYRLMKKNKLLRWEKPKKRGRPKKEGG